MAESIGELIDKLTIANVKIWHIEEARRGLSDGSEEIAVDLHRKLSFQNEHRNELIAQINAAFRVLFDATKGVDSHLAISAEDLLGGKEVKYYTAGG